MMIIIIINKDMSVKSISMECIWLPNSKGNYFIYYIKVVNSHTKAMHTYTIT